MAEPRRRRRRNVRVRLNPLNHFDDFDFLSRYRLPKYVVEQLTRRFAASPFLSTYGDGRGSVVAPPERVCAALRYLATGANYSTIADFQGISKATLTRCVQEVIDFLGSLANEIIVWPRSRQDQEHKAREFYQKFGKPCTIGCVDGTQIPILRPPMDLEASYLNRKFYHSLNVMIVCDAHHNIMWVEERFPGRVHDSFVLMASSVEDFGNNGHMAGFWLLGDSGYAQKEWLMVPFRNPQHRGQLAYNAWHRSSRCVVERTIGLLKQRWRCLNAAAGYLVHKPRKCCEVILACCVLHNIANAGGHPIDLDEDADGLIPVGRRRYGDIVLEREALPDFIPEDVHNNIEIGQAGNAAHERFVDRAFLNQL